MNKTKPLFVYNFYTHTLEKFEPIHADRVGMYVCGPTVSGESHLGHARPFITFDVVYRYLSYLGYRVRYVRNITDAGHFEEEGREAEDKISTKAKLESLEPMELVGKYIRLFHDAMKKFNVLPPTVEPTATGHIVEQIEMIKTLISKGYAYEVNGSVYFDVYKYAQTYPYGRLSGRILDDLLNNTRTLNNQHEKKNSVDFALWKKAPPEHIMRWVSPWGEGFPGWHIECSAMSTKYLGKEFDIHGGGMDLLFPHHESEIAQSNICNGSHLPAKYWLYNNMITINGKKMGKSYNNHITLSDMFQGENPLLDKAYSPMTIRFFILQTHYRSTLDFSNEALRASEKGMERLGAAYQIIQSFEIGKHDAIHTNIDAEVNLSLDAFDEDMSADFNTAKVLARMFEIATIVNSIKHGQLPLQTLSSQTIEKMKNVFDVYINQILGLSFATRQGDISGDVINLLIEIRNQAKQEKKYEWSDTIRNRLSTMGVLLKDEKDGTTSFTIKS